jgi:hypothetical protein
MRYYLVNLAIHMLILAVLILLACIFAKRNRKRKTKSVIGYFLPTFFAILAILDLTLLTAPRLMDISSVAGRSYYYDTGEVTEVSFLKTSFVVDGKRYYMNPMRLKIKVGDTVRIKHTQYARFTSEVIDVSNFETLPSETEEKK